MRSPVSLLCCLLTISGLTLCVPAATATPLNIETINLRMDATDAAVLVRKDPHDKSSFAVTLIDGANQLPGRIKTMGSSSQLMDKRSFYVKLAKGSKWQGQRRLSLNGMGSDPTQMRNRLVWELFHELGVPGPQTHYRRIELNGKPQGLYLQLEWIEGKMFERYGLGSDGELYHPQDSHFCGDLGKMAKYDIDDCWFKYSPPFDDFSSLQKLIDEINATPIAEFDRFMERNFDTESVVNWLAVNVLVANGDTYNKNYFLYRSSTTGKWSVIPWDYDLTFGRTFDTYLHYPESVFNDRFEYFYPPELGAYNPLKVKTLSNPALLARFRARLAHLIGLRREEGKNGFAIFSPEKMTARIETLKAQLLPEVRNDPYLGGNIDTFLENVDAIEHFVLARTGYLTTAIFGNVPWNPEVVYWHPEESPRPLPYPDKLQATAMGSGTVAVVANGYGYLLAVVRPDDPQEEVSVAAESQFGQAPRLLPPGVSPDSCIQRTWYVTIRTEKPQINGRLTLEYLQENSVLHELGQITDEAALKLWRYEAGQWQKIDASVNTLANTLTVDRLLLTSERTMRYVACTDRSEVTGEK